jgi:hypothetical protein
MLPSLEVSVRSLQNRSLCFTYCVDFNVTPIARRSLHSWFLRKNVYVNSCFILSYCISPFVIQSNVCYCRIRWVRASVGANGSRHLRYLRHVALFFFCLLCGLNARYALFQLLLHHCFDILFSYSVMVGAWGSVVVKALRY